MSNKTGSDVSASSAKRIQSSDYKAWDKYNVEKECAKVEEGEGPVAEGPVAEGKGSVHKDIGKVSEKGEMVLVLWKCLNAGPS